MFWWQNVSKYSRPLLVVGTSISNQAGKSSVQIWDTRNGRGTKVFSVNLGTGENEVSFARGLGSCAKENKTNVLFVGLSTGEVYGYEVNRKSLLEKTCALKGLTGPVSCVAGNKSGSPYISAADERGNVAVWKHSDDKWVCVFRCGEQSEYCCSIAMKAEMLVMGSSSGVVSFYDVSEGRKLAETVTNAKAITCLDVHETQEALVVGGEDCRAAVLTLPNGVKKPAVMLSVSLSGLIVGARFACIRPDRPDIVLLLWERNYLIRYDFVDS